jgi:hypothetical protein
MVIRLPNWNIHGSRKRDCMSETNPNKEETKQ